MNRLMESSAEKIDQKSQIMRDAARYFGLKEPAMAILLIKDESGLERRAEIQPLPFRIGKKAGHNALVLDHISISREHCVIFQEKDGFAVVDSESRNGTYLNGRRLAGREGRCMTATRSGSGRSR